MNRFCNDKEVSIKYVNKQISVVPQISMIARNMVSGAVINEIPFLDKKKYGNDNNIFAMAESVKAILDEFKEYDDSESKKYKVNIIMNIKNSDIWFDDGKIANYSHNVGRISVTSNGKVYYQDFGILTNIKEMNKSLIEKFNLLTAKFENVEKKKKLTEVLDKDTVFVLAPQAAAFFVHELIGHMFEKDNYNSALFEKDSVILPKECQIVDSPMTSDFIKCGKYDDFGQEIKETIIVKDGTCCNIIDYRRSADYSMDAIYRMYNLCMLGYKNGNDLCQIIEKYKKCIVIKEIINGGVNANIGDYFLMCKDVCAVHSNGERVLLDPITLGGNVKETLKHVIEIGSDFNSYIGTCTKKGQNIYVSTGSPSIVLDTLNIIQ